MGGKVIRGPGRSARVYHAQAEVESVGVGVSIAADTWVPEKEEIRE